MNFSNLWHITMRKCCWNFCLLNSWSLVMYSYILLRMQTSQEGEASNSKPIHHASAAVKSRGGKKSKKNMLSCKSCGFRTMFEHRLTSHECVDASQVGVTEAHFIVCPHNISLILQRPQSFFSYLIELKLFCATFGPLRWTSEYASIFSYVCRLSAANCVC